MGYYIQFSGITTNLKIPVLTFDRVVMDFMAEHRLLALLGYQRYFTTNFNGVKSSLYRNLAGKDKKENLPAIKMNGIPFIIDTDTIQTNKRVVIEFSFDGQPNTSESTLFADLGGLTDNLNGRLYDLRFFLGNRIVAHYNPEFKNVQDLSGNGKHATVSGGTFVEDKAITGKVVNAGVITMTNTLVQNETLDIATKISNISATLQTSGELSTTANKISNAGSITLSSIVDLNTEVSKIASGKIELSGISELETDISKIAQNEIDLYAKSDLTGELNKVKPIEAEMSSGLNVNVEATKIKSGLAVLYTGTELTGNPNKISSVQSDLFSSNTTVSADTSKIVSSEVVISAKTTLPDVEAIKIIGSGPIKLVSQTTLTSSSIPAYVKEIQSELLVRTGIQSDTVIRRGIKSNLQTISFADTELKI